ncbi:hypothetical protein CF15_04985 [Pyrodictium occultum]|uniref:Uncharacterized protein n=1 Tax=Pyrodictium occultum TaxID=2309 RepID=A0A0V8RVP9_PYROC|nr:hypothetical protein [Pyrodictium occultum]KSW12124.1 hypothetical protein CF15_04985 [Pyrodictium occultum]
MRRVSAGSLAVLAAALLGAALLAVGAAAAGDGHHYVEIRMDGSFVLRLTGYIEFTVHPRGAGTIVTDSGPVVVNPGDRVRLVFNTTRGYIHFNSGGWVEIRDTPVEAIYVNDRLVASNTTIRYTGQGLRYQQAEASTLKAVVAPEPSSGEGPRLVLVVDGHSVEVDHGGYVVVYNLAPGPAGPGRRGPHDLVVDLAGFHKWLRGAAEGVEFWTDSGVKVIGVDELPLLRGLAQLARQLLG